MGVGRKQQQQQQRIVYPLQSSRKSRPTNEPYEAAPGLGVPTAEMPVVAAPASAAAAAAAATGVAQPKEHKKPPKKPKQRETLVNSSTFGDLHRRDKHSKNAANGTPPAPRPSTPSTPSPSPRLGPSKGKEEPPTLKSTMTPAGVLTASPLAALKANDYGPIRPVSQITRPDKKEFLEDYRKSLSELAHACKDKEKEVTLSALDSWPCILSCTPKWLPTQAVFFHRDETDAPIMTGVSPTTATRLTFELTPNRKGFLDGENTRVQYALSVPACCYRSLLNERVSYHCKEGDEKDIIMDVKLTSVGGMSNINTRCYLVHKGRILPSRTTLNALHREHAPSGVAQPSASAQVGSGQRSHGASGRARLARATLEGGFGSFLPTMECMWGTLPLLHGEAHSNRQRSVYTNTAFLDAAAKLQTMPPRGAPSLERLWAWLSVAYGAVFGDVNADPNTGYAEIRIEPGLSAANDAILHRFIFDAFSVNLNTENMSTIVEAIRSQVDWNKGVVNIPYSGGLRVLVDQQLGPLYKPEHHVRKDSDDLTVVLVFDTPYMGDIAEDGPVFDTLREWAFDVEIVFMPVNGVVNPGCWDAETVRINEEKNAERLAHTKARDVALATDTINKLRAALHSSPAKKKKDMAPQPPAPLTIDDSVLLSVAASSSSSSSSAASISSSVAAAPASASAHS